MDFVRLRIGFAFTMRDAAIIVGLERNIYSPPKPSCLSMLNQNWRNYRE
jgi:hypothetical protein